MDGMLREADVGLLYDPASPAEAGFCAHWKTALGHCAPELEVRRNNPYRGNNDGLTTVLRKQFPDSGYIGIELEINQRHVFGEDAGWSALLQALISSLRHALARTVSGRTRNARSEHRIGTHVR
jgi:predicted N-formylglutamate amidohydrolase